LIKSNTDDAEPLVVAAKAGGMDPKLVDARINVMRPIRKKSRTDTKKSKRVWLKGNSKLPALAKLRRGKVGSSCKRSKTNGERPG